jgi:chromosome segregation ATPase
VREAELRLQKEIEVVRKEMKEAELRLQGEIEGVRKDIEVVRKEMKEVELRLQKEIDQVRVDLKSTEANLRTAIHRQTIWIIGAIGAVTGFIRLLDWLLA